MEYCISKITKCLYKLVVENGICTRTTYDTSSSIGIIILACVPEGAGHCDLFRIFQAHTKLRSYECQRNSPLAWCIDPLVAGRRFLPRHINQNNQLITYPTHTTHSHTPSRQYNCTMGNKKIYIMEIPQCQTKWCSLYNSISGATDYCALSLHSTCIHRRSVGRGMCLPPKTNLLASLGGTCPQNFYRINNDLESLFEKNKQFLQNLFKFFLKLSKISNYFIQVLQNFLIFPTNHP